jgi:hypothetical protein
VGGILKNISILEEQDEFRLRGAGPDEEEVEDE